MQDKSPLSKTDGGDSVVFPVMENNGSNGARTHDLLVVTQTLSQLSYASLWFYYNRFWSVR